MQFQLSRMIQDCTWNLVRSCWQQEIKALSNTKHSDHGKGTVTMKLDRLNDGQFFPTISTIFRHNDGI